MHPGLLVPFVKLQAVPVAVVPGQVVATLRLAALNPIGVILVTKLATLAAVAAQAYVVVAAQAVPVQLEPRTAA